MRVKYFQDTDALHVEFRAGRIAETRDLDENTLLELDDQGHLCAMTVEHASWCTGAPAFSYEQIVACSAPGPNRG